MATAQAADGRQATELWGKKGSFHLRALYGSLLTLLPRKELSRALTPKVRLTLSPSKGARDVNVRGVGEHTDGNKGQLSTPAKNRAEGQKGPATEQQLVVSALTGVDIR